MNCEEARAAFTDLYDGTVTGPPLVDLSQHLDGCPDCQWEWAAFRRAVHAVRDLGEAEPSRDFAVRVAGRIAEPPWWRRATRALVYPLPVKLPIHAAALVVLGLVGAWVSQRSPELRRAADVVVPISPGRTAQAERVAQPPPAAPPVISSAPAQRPKVAPRAPSPPAESAARTAPAPPRPARDEVATPAPSPPPGLASPAESETGAAEPLRAARVPLESRRQAESIVPEGLRPPAEKKGQPAPSARTADEIFSAAATEFAAQRYEKAIEAFRAFLARHPNDGRAPDARFLLADAYRVLGRHVEAARGFATFLRQYPEHRRAPAALYRQAESRLAAADPSGCAVLRDALNRYPEAREAPTARETLAARCP